jgi:glycosyltransferase involved in cell wall biosynthesis
VWFDVSYTRTQQGTIGITRAVRRLSHSASPDGELPGAVAYHGGGFRHVSLPGVASPGAERNGEHRSVGERIFAGVTGRTARLLVLLAVKLLPWRLLRPLWEVCASATFGALSRDAEPVRFGPGDLLVIADVAWSYPVWRAARSARQQGAQVLLVVYDLMPIRRPEFCFALVPPVFTTFLRAMLRCSDAVICISRAAEDDLRQWAAQEGLALPPTGFFHLGSDAVAGVPAIRVRHGIAALLAEPTPCFAAVGSFEPKKNYPLLLRVFERLWAQGHQVRLLIAGRETPDCAAFTRALRQHPQQGRLLVTVHDASDAEVAAVYAGCRALLFPSLFEGFGLPLVEARARACRVLASDIPAFAELADEGVTLFDPHDPESLARSILSLCGDMPPAPARAPGLTWAQSAEQFHRVVRRLLAAG